MQSTTIIQVMCTGLHFSLTGNIFSNKEVTKSTIVSLSQFVLCLHSCSWDRKLVLGTFQEVIMEQTFNFSGHHESSIKLLGDVILYISQKLLPITLKCAVNIRC